MAKRKGNYYMTSDGIYNLDSYVGVFDIDYVKGVMFRVDNPKITWEIIDKTNDLFGFITFKQDIIEVEELGQLKRYTLVKDIETYDQLLTVEGVINVKNISAILCYHQTSDSYVRYKVMG